MRASRQLHEAGLQGRARRGGHESRGDDGQVARRGFGAPADRYLRLSDSARLGPFVPRSPDQLRLQPGEERRRGGSPLLNLCQRRLGGPDVVEDLSHLAALGLLLISCQYLAEGRVGPFESRGALSLATQGRSAQQRGVGQLPGGRVQCRQRSPCIAELKKCDGAECGHGRREWRRNECLVRPRPVDGIRVGDGDEQRRLDVREQQPGRPRCS